MVTKAIANSFANCRRIVYSAVIWIAVFVVLAMAALAEQPPARIAGTIDDGQRATVAGSHSPMARPSNDIGRVPSGTRLQGMSLVFRRTDAQQADLLALIAAQQQTSSTLYHKWLTPEEFATRFGMAQSDIEQVKSWLERQGFSVDGVARSQNRITFSGTVGQAESAFGTEIHYYKAANSLAGGKTNYAPSADLTIPAAIYSVVQSVDNLSTFRPQPRVKIRRPQSAVKPDFTSNQSGSHYLTPGDVATIYDIKAAYSAGYTGTGQSIAIVGQSSIEASDIENFQTAAGLTVKDPTQVLVPGTGSAAVSSGDEVESDLDLEYAGAIAKGATIYFVYVGNNANYSAFDSIQYAVDTRISPIISTSYGECETDLGSANYSTLNSILEQAASQGQSVISAAGDSGSTGCAASTDLSTAQTEALAVDYPASSQYVTGMGGTEFPSSDVASSNTTYWTSASGSDVISSALSYIPEQVWNDDSSSNGISSGGGGVSTLTARPSWQTGVTGIPSGSYRLVPDISLDSSPNNAGYLYCSSDSTSTGITGSCSNGFRDSSNQYLTVAGGTSFAAPIFAGMLAIINEKENSTGQGVVNTTLYTVAANSSTYASAFHDITSGSNACTAGSSYCSSAGESGYTATTGYDEATGLGSIDLYNLMTSWPASTASSLAASTTRVTAASATPASGASDAITITVAAPSSTSISSTPTGTLTVAVDGTTETSSLALSNGTATYTFSSTTSGSHVIEVTYSGDSTYAGSTGTATVTVGGSTTSSGGSFTLGATNATVAQGSSGTSTITITSQNSYAGTVGFTLSTDNSSLQTYGCYDVSNTSVAAGATATATMTLYTSQSVCNSTTSVKKGATRHYFAKSVAKTATAHRDSPASRTAVPISAAAFVAGVLCFGVRRRKSHMWAALSCFALLGALGAAIGCGSSGSSSSASTSTSTDVPKGTYSLAVDGTDTSNSGITAQATFTLTVN